MDLYLVYLRMMDNGQMSTPPTATTKTCICVNSPDHWPSPCQSTDYWWSFKPNVSHGILDVFSTGKDWHLRDMDGRENVLFKWFALFSNDIYDICTLCNTANICIRTNPIAGTVQIIAAALSHAKWAIVESIEFINNLWHQIKHSSYEFHSNYVLCTHLVHFYLFINFSSNIFIKWIQYI